MQEPVDRNTNLGWRMTGYIHPAFPLMPNYECILPHCRAFSEGPSRRTCTQHTPANTMAPASSTRLPATSASFADSRSALPLAWPWTVRALCPLGWGKSCGGWGDGTDCNCLPGPHKNRDVTSVEHTFWGTKDWGQKVYWLVHGVLEQFRPLAMEHLT